MSSDAIANFLNEVGAALAAVDGAAVRGVAGRLVGAIREDRTIFLAGNGGSAATAAHLASDLTAACDGGPACLAVSLADNVPRLTAAANDDGHDDSFAVPLARMSRPGDVLLMLSVSGASPNLLRAARVAAERGLTVVALLGINGDALAALSDVTLRVRAEDPAVVESVHTALEHAVCRAVREELLPGRANGQSRGPAA